MQLAAVLYVITDILLKVVLNANKTDHQVIIYTWHIVESGIKHQYNLSPCNTLLLTLLTVALNTNKIRHQVILYNWHTGIVESGVKHQ